jgi:prolyl 4-hydroxylase
MLNENDCVEESAELSDKLITYFESNQNKQKKGVTLGGENLDVKNSIDILISPKETKLPGNEVFEEYFNSLFSCYKDYVVQWPFLTEFAEDL